MLDRRTLLRGATVLGTAAAVTGAGTIAGVGPATAAPGASGWGSPTRARAGGGQWGTARATAGALALSADPALHLLRRATFGPNADQLAEINRRGPAGWLDWQLNPAGVEDAACQAALGRFTLYAMSGQAFTAVARPPGSWSAMMEVWQATLLRAVCSRRQLFEVMVEFWQNHFAVTVPSDKVWNTAHVHDRETIRRHALGRFDDLLVATAKSPAMLRYLDNARSTARNPNENYGRELLELHTVGVEAGYGEGDVRASTYLMTGWGVDNTTQLFRYLPTARATGSYRVLGRDFPTAPASGLADGEAYLRWLARHPATAARLARKLAVRFVSDDPPAALVDRLAAAYLDAGTAIVPVLRALFASAEFWASAGAKLRRPLEQTLAAHRAVGTSAAPTGLDDWNSLGWSLHKRGHAPLAWPLPDGYPDVAAAWVSTSGTLGNWNAHRAVAGRWHSGKGITTPPMRDLLPATLPTTATAVVDTLCQRLLGQKLAPEHRSAVTAFLQPDAADRVPAWKLQEWNLANLVSLILSSPYFAAR
jgi:uncharacterized protein (DUF1800 family)